MEAKFSSALLVQMKGLRSSFRALAHLVIPLSTFGHTVVNASLKVLGG